MPQRPEYKAMIVLANSRKHSLEQNGRCVAGIELRDGNVAGWVRPVSSRPHGEVSEYERQYRDGADPVLLDVVGVPLIGHTPNSFQTENWLLDPQYYWVRKGRLNVSDLAQLVNPDHLWLTVAPDTRFGLNDRVDLKDAAALSDSLRFIHVEDLHYRVFAPSADYGNHKRRVLALFTHAGVEYRLYVTDPVVEGEYLALAGREHAVGPAYLTVSLGEPYDGYTYKLVAAVIPG